MIAQDIKRKPTLAKKISKRDPMKIIGITSVTIDHITTTEITDQTIITGPMALTIIKGIIATTILAEHNIRVVNETGTTTYHKIRTGAITMIDLQKTH